VITSSFLDKFRGVKQDFLFQSSNYQRFLHTLYCSSKTVVNEKEIRIAGLRRTGNHAIVGWIRAQHPEPTRHLNHPPPGHNPYQFLYKHYRKDELKQASKGNFSSLNLLIISYEDDELCSVASPNFERFHDVYVGSSRCRYDVLVLRDPFNLMASQIKARMVSLLDETASRMMALWTSYAKEFLGETRFLTHQKICINFNRWHQNLEYRKDIADQLAIDFTDAGREQVRDYGGGSSFDSQQMNGQANKMDLLNRWRVFETEEKFWQLFQNDQTVYYTDRIFGQDNLPFHYLK
jgi:hypothetical protein